MRAHIYITLKNGVLDPQGKAIEGTLQNLGFDGIENVRQGKLIEISLDDSTSLEAAEKKVEKMCANLLANTVIEDYRFEIREAS